MADECDAALQYNLARYSYLYENTMVSEALVISPVSTEDGNYTIQHVEYDIHFMIQKSFILIEKN